MKSNLIKYYDIELKEELLFNYIYQGDTQYLLLNKDNKAIMYIDIDNYDFIDTEDIKTRQDEEEAIITIIDFIMNDYDYLTRYEILQRVI